MVKYISTLLVVFAVMAFASPAAFAQDIQGFEIMMGYGNINIEDSGRHSGFVSHQTINLNSWFALDNGFGAYSLGTDPSVGKIQLISNIFGAKFTYRAEKVHPYVSAGFGGGFLRFPDSGSGSNNAIAARFGGGLDFPFKDNFAWKIDVSRASYHFNGWNSGTSVSTGIVIKVGS
jgi:hypothetical protein